MLSMSQAEVNSQVCLRLAQCTLRRSWRCSYKCVLSYYISLCISLHFILQGPYPQVCSLPHANCVHSAFLLHAATGRSSICSAIILTLSHAPVLSMLWLACQWRAEIAQTRTDYELSTSITTNG